MATLEEIFGLRGRVALVTGASSGLGAEAARALALAGANLGLLARRVERLEGLARELEQSGVRALAAPADVTDPGALEAAITRVEAALGPIDVLVNGAGVAPLSRAAKHSREKWDQALAVNLTGPFLASQAVARRMIARREGGTIVMISSVIGRGANPVHRAVGYTASKHGLDGLTRQLAVEWAPHGIRVNGLAPSYFPSEMTVDPAHGEVAPEQAAVMRRFTPMDRLGRPGELASALLFLTAPGSSYVTGTILPVDGGWSAW